jgi:phage-related protein
VLEIVESHQANAYRAVYTVRFEKAVYVLHAFHKSLLPAFAPRNETSISSPSA